MTAMTLVMENQWLNPKKETAIPSVIDYYDFVMWFQMMIDFWFSKGPFFSPV